MYARISSEVAVGLGMGGRLTGTRTVSYFQVSIIGELCPQFTNIARQHSCAGMRNVSQVGKLGQTRGW